ncbi:alkylated DNA repair dioxygenase [Amylibacter kogurei]|uniref:Alkylated DNA repair dioxygenase n=1 Tax=Paramylibacter kogurei TaxID=1889778 RepID=A0A2G5KC31_9RHOB|nr:alpha-ketoglutarate-dependent dioxygenase AlkB [Amylibacter kogurei]PIB26602.1 alkylated DNA repair dioxygenase [Amylibacter kogurei]
MPFLDLAGFQVYKSYLSSADQQQLATDLRQVVSAAPMFSPSVKTGAQMSVRMSAAGKYGWHSDASGYRYIDHHPNGTAWPDIPDSVLSIWQNLVSTSREPDCCLINFYGEGAKMGLHQDNDEADYSYPVLSISLGDSALFRVGGTQRGGKTQSIWLDSGDVVVMGGDARLAYHGVDRIKFASSRLFNAHGRLNLTLRVVD